ncbi:MAG: hypothetical protein ABJA75_07690 [Bradyrhizobium sp.]
MLRWTMPLLVAVFTVGTAAADEPLATKPADQPVAAKPADVPVATKPADAPVTTKRADGPAATKRATVRAASKLPPGLPRAHYNYHTTVAPNAAPKYVRRGRQLVVVEEEDPDVLFTPVGVVPYAPRVFGTPVLPGSSTLPGYYGTGHSYSYDGAYYGGPQNGPYWSRLPYACGVFGYC